MFSPYKTLPALFADSQGFVQLLLASKPTSVWLDSAFSGIKSPHLWVQSFHPLALWQGVPAASPAPSPAALAASSCCRPLGASVPSTEVNFWHLRTVFPLSGDPVIHGGVQSAAYQCWELSDGRMVSLWPHCTSFWYGSTERRQLQPHFSFLCIRKGHSVPQLLLLIMCKVLEYFWRFRVQCCIYHTWIYS